MAIQEDLLEILVCPLSKAALVYDEEAEKLISTDRATRRRYSIENGIPIMLVDDEHSERGRVGGHHARARARRRPLARLRRASGHLPKQGAPHARGS